MRGFGPDAVSAVMAVPLGCLRFVIVVFPDHTHLLFLPGFKCLISFATVFSCMFC